MKQHHQNKSQRAALEPLHTSLVVPPKSRVGTGVQFARARRIHLLSLLILNCHRRQSKETYLASDTFKFTKAWAYPLDSSLITDIPSTNGVGRPNRWNLKGVTFQYPPTIAHLTTGLLGQNKATALQRPLVRPCYPPHSFSKIQT